MLWSRHTFLSPSQHFNSTQALLSCISLLFNIWEPPYFNSFQNNNIVVIYGHCLKTIPFLPISSFTIASWISPFILCSFLPDSLHSSLFDSSFNDDLRLVNSLQLMKRNLFCPCSWIIIYLGTETYVGLLSAFGSTVCYLLPSIRDHRLVFSQANSCSFKGIRPVFDLTVSQ